MEMIVKIGADQQGLDQTLQRIASQFKRMDTSMPARWLPQQAAVNQYGKIFEPVADSFGDSAINSLQKRSGEFLKGMVIGSLTSLILEGLESVNKKFWESFYNSGEEAMNRMADLSERVTGTVSRLQSARATAEARREKEMKPRELADYLIKKRSRQETAVNRLQGEYDSATETANDLRSGKATHLDGSKFTDFERQGAFLKASESEAKLLEAREKLAQLNDRIKAAVELDQKQTQSAITDAFKPTSPSKETILQTQEEKIVTFQANQMAQAGLFSRSDLLYNPDGSVQQEQLETLRAIRANTEKLCDGAL